MPRVYMLSRGKLMLFRLGLSQVSWLMFNHFWVCVIITESSFLGLVSWLHH